MDFSEIDSIPWAELETAYGSADKAPQSLRALMSDVEDDIDEAIYGFLHSEVCHQYTTYSCTPFVVKFVIKILDQKEFNNCELAEILGFIRACSHSAESKDSLRNEILAGKDIYSKYIRIGDRVSDESSKLIKFCNRFDSK